MGRAVVLSLTVLAGLTACGGSGGGNPASPLDITFNSRGWTTGDGAAGGFGDDAARGIGVDASGGILVAGYSVSVLGDDDMAIWRINGDGSSDWTFNGQGSLTHDSAAGGGGDDSAHGMTIDGSGRVLVVGTSRAPGPDQADMAAWRYDGDGALDTTFNGLGWVTHHDAAGGGKGDVATGVAVDPTGRVLVAGYSRRSGGNDDMVVWRFLGDGTLDLGFNGKGWVTHDDAAGGSKQDRGNDLAIDAVGRILVAGHSRGPGGNVDMVVWRFGDDGSLDVSFDGRGWVVHDDAAGGGSRDEGRAITLDEWGRIVVTGFSLNATGDADMALWRFGDDGSLDPTLDGRGYLVHDNAAGGANDDAGHAIILDGSRRILVAGTSVNRARNEDMVLWRFESDGGLDTTFNGQGWFVHDSAAGGSGEDVGGAIALDSLGRVLVAGSSMNPAGNRDMVVWRFRAPAVPDAPRP